MEAGNPTPEGIDPDKGRLSLYLLTADQSYGEKFEIPIKHLKLYKEANTEALTFDLNAQFDILTTVDQSALIEDQQIEPGIYRKIEIAFDDTQTSEYIDGDKNRYLLSLPAEQGKSMEVNLDVQADQDVVGKIFISPLESIKMQSEGSYELDSSIDFVGDQDSTLFERSLTNLIKRGAYPNETPYWICLYKRDVEITKKPVLEQTAPQGTVAGTSPGLQDLLKECDQASHIFKISPEERIQSVSHILGTFDVKIYYENDKVDKFPAKFTEDGIDF